MLVLGALLVAPGAASAQVTLPELSVDDTVGTVNDTVGTVTLDGGGSINLGAETLDLRRRSEVAG